MIIGSFIGRSVKGLEKQLGVVSKLHAKIAQVKQHVRDDAEHAMADRAAAMAELTAEVDAIGGILRRLD